MRVELIGEWDSRARTSIKRVIKLLSDHSAIHLPKGDINVKLVDEATSRALNEDYSGNAYATDVLTFVYPPEPESDVADIAICYPVAVEQAAAAGSPVATELTLLTLHGVLHVAGYDHQTTEQQAQIDKLQRELMNEAKLTYRDFQWHQ